MYPRLALNTQQLSCLSFLSAGIIDVYHHAWLLSFPFKLFILILIVSMHMGVYMGFVCVCVCGTLEGQKRECDPWSWGYRLL